MYDCIYVKNEYIIIGDNKHAITDIVFWTWGEWYELRKRVNICFCWTEI